MKFDPFHQLSARPEPDPEPASPPPYEPSSFSLFAEMFVAELGEAVPAAQRRGFYLAVGRRMAAVEALDGVSDVAALNERVNAFWKLMGWGQAEIALEREAIVVRHFDPPLPGTDAPTGPWLGMLLAVLEGAYDCWFRKLGSGPALNTTAEWKGDTVELRHGR